jgi:hypothetical protein
VDVSEQPTAPVPATGPCEECKANRRRLISLAADVSGLRIAQRRWDGLADQEEHIKYLEMSVMGLAVIVFVLYLESQRRGK